MYKPLFFVSATMALFTSAPQKAYSDHIPPCSLRSGIRAVPELANMPGALRDAVKGKLGDIVPPGAPFDATDFVVFRHNRRLIFIWTRGEKWIIATEHGGRGYNDPIFAYFVSLDGSKATLFSERIASPKTVCSTAEALLRTEPGAPADHQKE